MKTLLELAEHWDQLWEQLENRLEAWLARTAKSAADCPSTTALKAQENDSLPHPLHEEAEESPRNPADEIKKAADEIKKTTEEIKNLTAAVMILKRIQEARCDIRLNAKKWEAATANGRIPDAINPEEISRALDRLEREGLTGDAPDDHEDAV